MSARSAVWADTQVGPYECVERRRPIAQHSDDDVVTIGKDVGPDLDSLAYGAFDRKAAAVDLGPNVLDDDAADDSGRLALIRTSTELRRTFRPCRRARPRPRQGARRGYGLWTVD